MARKRLSTRTGTNTRYNLTEAERYALCCYCVFDTTKLDVFKLAHPEIVGTKNVLKSQCEQFFASSDVVNFMREYRAYLDGLDKEEKTEAKENNEDLSARMQHTKRNIFLRGEELANSIGATKEELELAIKLLDKSGVFDTDEEVMEQPRRYLPETCRSSCRYRAFVEQECEDLCEYCKYKKYGEENGVHYEIEKQLEIPNNES